MRMNSEAMFDPERELRSLRQFERDRKVVASYSKNLSQYQSRIIDADDVELKNLENELQKAYLVARSYDDLMKSDLRVIERLRYSIEQKKKGMRPTLVERVTPVFLQTPKNEKTRSVTLRDVVDYYEANGLVGERETSVLQTLGAVKLLSFGIESLSGSGKSYSAELLMKLLPKGTVYKMELSSKTAELYNTDEINKAKIIYIPELQKAMNSNPLVIEMLKNITEGKDAVRNVRDQANGANKKLIIKGDKGVIFTLATENAFKYDAEFGRRVFILHTDISTEQTERILEQYAMRNIKRMKDFSHLSEHIRECMDSQYDVVNPFAEYIVSRIPKVLKARSYAKHLFNLIDACSTFNHRQRESSDSKLFASLEDVFVVNELYGRQFLKSLYDVPLLGELVLDAAEEGNSSSAQEIHERLKQKLPDVSYSHMALTLERLVNGGFIKKDDSRTPKYMKNGVPSFDLGIDYSECWRSGTAFMKSCFPEHYAQWHEKQVHDGDVQAYDAVKKIEVPIANDRV